MLPEATPKKVRTGLAAVDPATGEVVAFYGGRYPTNRVRQRLLRQGEAGSTFKPYTLAAALDNGFDLVHPGQRQLADAGGLRPRAPSPTTAAARTGEINLVSATQNSVNTAFVDLGQKVGLDKVVAAAERPGIPAGAARPARARPPRFPLGVASVSAVQNASGFATFATGGVHMEAHVVRSVTDANGRTGRSSPAATRAFSEQAAADTTYAMQQVVKYGTGTAARLYDRPVAGKTGTTDESPAVWFTGFTPQLAVAVDMFRDDNKPVTSPVTACSSAGSCPPQIWRAFMTEAMAGKPVKEFPEPSDYGYYLRTTTAPDAATTTSDAAATDAHPAARTADDRRRARARPSRRSPPDPADAGRRADRGTEQATRRTQDPAPSRHRRQDRPRHRGTGPSDRQADPAPRRRPRAGPRRVTRRRASLSGRPAAARSLAGW